MIFDMTKIDQVTLEILDLLRLDTRGLTVQELADSTKTTRITANMALMKLEGQGSITVRRVGNCKLHYIHDE